MADPEPRRPVTQPRPKNWEPLGQGDPTPGDVAGVRAGMHNMAETGQQIRDQIKRLKAISEDSGALKGKYVDELKNGSDKLKGKLEKTAGRYERVSSQLEKWANQLEDAQVETARALKSAKQAQETIDQLIGEGVTGDAAKKAEESLDPAKSRQLDEARGDLERAKSRYDAAVRGYGEDSKRVADKIRDIIDDAVEDGVWSWFSNLIERNIDGLKKVLEVIGYIVTALAIVALVIIVLAAVIAMPAALVALAPLLLTAGTVLSVVTLAAHSAMALTGNGGWGDVAFDIVGLLTFKMGNAAAKGIKAGAQATKKASRGAAKSQAKAAKDTPRYKELKDNFAQAKTKKQKAGALKAMREYEKRNKPKGVSQNAPKPSAGEVFRAGGSREAAERKAFALREAAKRPGDEATQQAAQSTARYGAANTALFGGGTALDLGDKAAGSSDLYPDKPNVGPYSDAKDWNFYNTGLYDYAP